MKVLLLGTRGWLGGMFFNYLKKSGVDVEFRNEDINSLCYLNPDITAVVNFAAHASIDWSEKNRNRTFWSNVLGAQNVAKVCKAAGVKHVFISSACVLRSEDENDIKYENDIPSPRCFYTETKLMAEKLIMEIDSNALITRIRLPISSVPHPRNALNKLASYKKLINCQESVVIVEDLLPKILELIREDASGIYHLSNEGTISPAEIGALIGHKFEVIKKEDLDKMMEEIDAAKRTSTILGSRKGYLPNIRDRIADVVKEWKNEC